jgi:hypothetical protein
VGPPATGRAAAPQIKGLNDSNSRDQFGPVLSERSQRRTLITNRLPKSQRTVHTACIGSFASKPRLVDYARLATLERLTSPIRSI